MEYWLADTTWFVEMLAGDAVAAEAGIRIVEGSAAAPVGEPVEAAVGSRLAHSLCAQGRYEEAGESLLASQQDLERARRHAGPVAVRERQGRGEAVGP